MLTSSVNKSLGYPISHNQFDGETSINNAGDPFSKTNYYLVNTLKEEKELVEFYAKDVLRIKEDIWGVLCERVYGGDIERNVDGEEALSTEDEDLCIR